MLSNILKSIVSNNYQIASRTCRHSLIKKEDCDITFVVGIKGREKYLNSLLKHFERASRNSSKNIQFLLVEQGKEPQYIKLAEEKSISYLFLDTGNYENLYSRALSFNAAALKTKSKWLMFHDVDLIFHSDFFTKLEKYMNDNNPYTWIQPYSKKRVFYMDKNITDEILNNKNIEDFKEIKGHFGTPGAPGGSTLINRTLFESVGGYDPEIFFGYAPEDAMFWLKLETIVGRVGATKQIHNGYATYAEDIDLFHLNHPMEIGNNPYHQYMDILSHQIQSMSYEERLDYINFKALCYAGNK